MYKKAFTRRMKNCAIVNVELYICRPFRTTFFHCPQTWISTLRPQFHDCLGAPMGHHRDWI